MIDFTDLDNMSNVSEVSEENLNRVFEAMCAKHIMTSSLAKLFNKSSRGMSVSKSATAKGVVMKCVWANSVSDKALEELILREQITTPAVKHGKSYKKEALNALREHLSIDEKLFSIEPHRVYKGGEFVCGAPDAIIKDEAVIEVKCPYNPGNHLDVLINKDFYDISDWWKIQANMFLTGFKKGIFATYCPLSNEKLALIEVIQDNEAESFFYENFEKINDEIVRACCKYNKI